MEQMNCISCREKLFFYLNNDLSQEGNAEIEKHLENCPLCKTEFEKISNFESIINLEKDLKPNPFIATRIVQKLAENDNKTFIWKQKLQPVLFSFLIVIALLGGISLGNSYNKIGVSDSYSEQIEEYYFNEIIHENIEIVLLTENIDE